MKGGHTISRVLRSQCLMIQQAKNRETAQQKNAGKRLWKSISQQHYSSYLNSQNQKWKPKLETTQDKFIDKSHANRGKAISQNWRNP